MSGYIVGRILNQLTSDQRFSNLIYHAKFFKIRFGSMLPGSFFFLKDDSYRDLIQDSQLGAIGHYWNLQNLAPLSKKVWNMVFFLGNHDNICRFIDIKSLSLRQVCLAEKLSRYYFWIDYYNEKSNKAADILCQFHYRSPIKKTFFKLKTFRSSINWKPYQ